MIKEKPVWSLLTPEQRKRIRRIRKYYNAGVCGHGSVRMEILQQLCKASALSGKQFKMGRERYWGIAA